MSTVKKGLDQIKQYQQEQREKAAARERPKADWFKWPTKTHTTAKVRFLQELDESATGYREDRGLGVIATEHHAPGPEGYKRRGLCTLEAEGECYACERHTQDYTEGWRQRTSLYINAIVDFGLGQGEQVVVISRNANSAFSHALIEEAVEEGSITDANFRITKTGEGTGTNWLLKRLKEDPMDDSSVEVFDIDETVLRNIEYAKQPDYYGAVYTEASASSDGESSGTSTGYSADVDW